MPKKKKNKSSDKDKKAKKKTGTNERDTVFYEQQIIDNNRQLARLRARNDFLEAEVETLKATLARLEDDRSDVVAHLKRILQQKTEEVRELGERLLAMEELRKEEQIAYKTKEDAMQLDYHNMETNLNAEVKLVAGKLNALEDWKNARAELTRKFEIQEEEMAEQEKNHAKTLYEAEKSLVVGKAKMQKEMQERLNDLSLSFQEATNARIAEATQRAIRENIALNLEFDTTLKFCQKLEEKMQTYKEKEINMRLRASLLEAEAKMAMKKLVDQNRIIGKDAENKILASSAHCNKKRVRIFEVEKESLAEKMKEKNIETLHEAEEIKQNIVDLENSRKEVLDEVQNRNLQINKLNDLLNTVKSYVLELSQETVESHDEGCVPCDENFKQKLWEILNIIDGQDISNYISV